MTYIDYLNRFNQWVDDFNPPDKVIILYYSLLKAFNRKGWPEWNGIDTFTLMGLCHTSSNKTAIRARDYLAEAGFIEFKSGHKGKVTEYRLLEYCFKCYQPNDTEKNTEKYYTLNDTESDTQNDIENDTHHKNIDIRYKTKEKKKEKELREDDDKRPGLFDEGFGELIRYYEDRINPTENQLNLDKLKPFYDSMGLDCCKRAIDIAVSNNVYRINYVLSVLRDKQKNGIKSIEAWDDYDNRMKGENNNGRTGYGRRNDGLERTPEEILEEGARRWGIKL